MERGICDANHASDGRPEALLQESLAVATRTDAMKPSDLTRVVIDTTVAAEGGDVPDRR